MCLKEIGLHAQTMVTILDSKVNMIGKTYMIKHEITHFDNE